jgi:hypothetical protein
MKEVLVISLLLFNKEQGAAFKEFLIKNKSLFKGKHFFDKYSYE